MNLLRHAILFCLCLGIAASWARADAAYDPDAGKVDFKSLEITWHDNDRNRDVPAKIYYPAELSGKLPIIIFSHGLGGSRDGYQYLGQYWASHGYVAVHLTHHGSDTQAILENGITDFKQTAQAIASDPTNAVDRVRDVSFAISALTDEDDHGKTPLKDHLDLEKVGLAGHSFGANTTMLIAGEITLSGRSFADDRVKCAIAMSPPVPQPKPQWAKAYSDIQIPLFVMTGTKDDSPIGDTKADVRRVPFDHVQRIPAYLLTLTGGDHMVFSGRRQNLPGDQRFHQLIEQGSVAFWDAYLRGNKDARNWLDSGAYEKLVGTDAKFEMRNVPAD